MKPPMEVVPSSAVPAGTAYLVVKNAKGDVVFTAKLTNFTIKTPRMCADSPATKLNVGDLTP